MSIDRPGDRLPAVTRQVGSDDHPTNVNALPISASQTDTLPPEKPPPHTHPELGNAPHRIPPSSDDDPMATRPIRTSAPGGDVSSDDYPADDAERIPTNEWRFDAMEGEAEGEDSHVIGGRYRIVEGLAMGGMGAVFKVRHVGLGKTFALKIIHQALSFDSQMMKFFTREAQVLSRLDHPGIVEITDFGHDDRFGAYLVMEYLTGETLHHRLDREGQLAVGAALDVGLQVAQALEHMHAAELVHCDIKPENIFLLAPSHPDEQGVQAIIIDFGLSKSVAAGATLNSSEMGGTPIYAAPEQLAGQAPQPNMDIYAVGLLLYHLLTGNPPFLGSTVEVCHLKMSENPPPLSSRLAGPVDEALEAVVMRALDRDPERRHSSMAELVADLQEIQARLFPAAAQPRPWHRSSRRATIPYPSSAIPGQGCLRCPVPIFFTDGEGKLTSVNPALGRLLREPTDTLVGRSLSDTRLGNIWKDADDAIREVRTDGRPAQRLVAFEGRRGATKLLIWLVPQTNPGPCGGVLWGMVVPLEPNLF